MKPLWMIACALLFSVTGFAATATLAPLSSEALAAILGQPAAGPCAAQPSTVFLAAHSSRVSRSSLEKALCTATASCGQYDSVSCSSDSSSTSCSGADRDCAVGQGGYVTCNGVTTSCPVCTQCDICAAAPDDCFACCRCEGYSPITCIRLCG